jgi:hypothetical protein
MERAGADTSTALDANFGVDMIRTLQLAGDSTHRATTGALTATLTDGGVNLDGNELLAHTRRTTLFIDVRLIFLAEFLNSGNHGGGGSFT